MPFVLEILSTSFPLMLFHPCGIAPIKVAPGTVVRFGSCPQEFTVNGAASLVAAQPGQLSQGQQAPMKQPESQKEAAVGEKRAIDSSASAEKPRRDKTIRCRHVLTKARGQSQP